MREIKDRNPIFYKNAEEMDKPVSVLLEELRKELTRIRGKIGDIQSECGWEEHLEHIPGALTCIICSMHHNISMIRKHEERGAKESKNIHDKEQTNQEVSRN